VFLLFGSDLLHALAYSACFRLHIQSLEHNFTTTIMLVKHLYRNMIGNSSFLVKSSEQYQIGYDYFLMKQLKNQS